MTRDDIRKLMGAYATGSLTDSERKALFEAALDDQDLFDELAREQAVREVIAEPGARDRLIAGLPPVGSEQDAAGGGWRKPLAWALATTFVLSMSVAAVMITRSTDSRRAGSEVAKLDTSSQPIAPAPTTIAPAPVPQSAAVPQPAPVATSTATASSRQRQGSAEKKSERDKAFDANGFTSDRVDPAKKTEVSDDKRLAKETDKAVSPEPAASPVPAPPPPITNLPLEARRAQPAPVPTSSFAPGPTPNPTQGGAVNKDQNQIAQAGESSKSQQAADQARAVATTGQVDQLRVQNAQVYNGPVADPQSKSTPQVGVAPGRGGAQAKTSGVAATRARSSAESSGGGGGGGAGGVVGGVVGRIGAAPRPAPFAFDYKIESEDLTLKFAADGYVSIHFVPGGVTVVGAHVTAGSTRRERIPANATEVTILFTAAPQPGAPGISLTKEPKDARSGTAEDAAGARIDLLLRLY